MSPKQWQAWSVREASLHELLSNRLSLTSTALTPLERTTETPTSSWSVAWQGFPSTLEFPRLLDCMMQLGSVVFFLIRHAARHFEYRSCSRDCHTTPSSSPATSVIVFDQCFSYHSFAFSCSFAVAAPCTATATTRRRQQRC